MFSQILMICVGNICRSPTAEWMLKSQLSDAAVRVSSAGIGALVGQSADPTALDLLADDGIDALSHRAQQVTRSHLQSADLVLVMEQGHIEALTHIDPASRGKTKLLGHWADGQEVMDPYRRPEWAYRACHQQIHTHILQWLPYLERMT